MHPKVDAYLKSSQHWRKEMEALRKIALDSGLTETFKWGKPCYTFKNDQAENNNVAIIQPFKEQCGFMFFKGCLLKDPKGLTESPGPNSRIARRMMFSSAEDVARQEKHLRDFIAQAIAVEKAGLSVEAEKTPTPVPDELLAAYKTTPGLKKAFAALTPGRQRAYLLHFGGAKQSKTRVSRIEKCSPRILAGKGLND